MFILDTEVPSDAWVDSVNLCISCIHPELTPSNMHTILNLGDFKAKIKNGVLEYYQDDSEVSLTDDQLLQIFKSNLKRQMLTYIYRKYN